MSFAIRRYADADHAAVRDLFIRVNRELAPPALREAFESYIERSLTRGNRPARGVLRREAGRVFRRA